MRGGACYSYDGGHLRAACRSAIYPTVEDDSAGFRVAEASEPSHDLPAVSEWGMVTMVLLVLAAGTLMWTRRGAIGAEAR